MKVEEFEKAWADPHVWPPNIRVQFSKDLASVIEAETAELREENQEWKEECERLAKVAEFWQNKQENPIKKPKIDNL